MPRPKGSKNKKESINTFLQGFGNKPKKKGWPKGKRRGPRKIIDTYKGIPISANRIWDNHIQDHEQNMRIMQQLHGPKVEEATMPPAFIQRINNTLAKVGMCISLFEGKEYLIDLKLNQILYII